jgi:hypothetical protein
MSERAGTGLLLEVSKQDGRASPKGIAPQFSAALERGRTMEMAAGIAYALDESAIRG